MLDLSIVVVTYNSSKHIKECLQSIIDSMGSLKYQIILIDNNSQDNTLNVINQYKDIKVICNDENIGYAKACNQATPFINGNNILFLNPDTLIQGDLIQKSMNFLKLDNENGILGVKLLNHDKSLQYSVGRFPTISNLIFDKVFFLNKILPVYFQRKESYYSKVNYPDWVSGAFFLVEKEVIDKIGGFDEEYFMYMEEVDFCYRAKQAGWQTVFYPETSVVHYNLGKSEKNRYNKYINQRIGLVNFFKKFYSSKKLNSLIKLLKLEIKFSHLPAGSLLEKYKQVLTNNKI